MHHAPIALPSALRAAARRPVVKRGAITMSSDPTTFLWNGTEIPLSPIESALFRGLVRRSRLSWAETNAILVACGSCIDSRDVMIHRIRRKFADAGAADPIETMRGWGIRFRTEPDKDGSCAFWIGATTEDRHAS